MNEKKKKSILVVDDEITVCKSIRQAILSESYEVDTALSGEEALKKDEENPYDLIVIDLMMVNHVKQFFFVLAKTMLSI